WLVTYCVITVCHCFFFSSRRRHTRFSRDWSSDVCSSDLYVSPSVWAWRPGRARAMRGYVDHVLALLPFEPEEYRKLQGPPCSYRSEERRVGKEGRDRGGPCH